ncbi:hypothetical protein MMC18_004254 [Xylographa bjoerkii]|nr:hypothetical protein [Xylographa bjoerkii]
MTVTLVEHTPVDGDGLDVPESVMAVRTAPLPNLLVSGLVSATELVSKIQTLISLLSTSLNSDLLEYKSYSLTYRDGGQAALFELQIGEEVVDDFCDMFMQPHLDSHLMKLSKWGLLGFQPVEGTELAHHWHMAVLKSVYVDGAERMERLQLRALNLTCIEAIPIWFKVLNFVADTAIEGLFIASIEDPNIAKLEEARKIRLTRKSSANSSLSISEPLAVQILMKLAKARGVGKSNAEKRLAARSACEDFFSSMQSVRRALERAQEVVQLSMAQKRNLFVEVYRLTTKAYATFSAVEELMRMYTVLMYSCGIAAATNAVNAVASAVLASKAATLRAALKPETWLTSIGRSVGVVNGPTVAEVGAQLGSQVKWAVGGSVLSVAAFAFNTGKAVQAKRKKDQCTKLAELIFQSWQAAAETNTLLRWVHTTNDEFNFVGHSGRNWEEFLKAKLDQEIPDRWKGASFLKLYLKDRLDELGEVSGDIQTSSKILFS